MYECTSTHRPSSVPHFCLPTLTYPYSYSALASHSIHKVNPFLLSPSRPSTTTVPYLALLIDPLPPPLPPFLSAPPGLTKRIVSVVDIFIIPAEPRPSVPALRLLRHSFFLPFPCSLLRLRLLLAPPQRTASHTRAYTKQEGGPFFPTPYISQRSLCSSDKTQSTVLSFFLPFLSFPCH